MFLLFLRTVFSIRANCSQLTFIVAKIFGSLTLAAARNFAAPACFFCSVKITLTSLFVSSAIVYSLLYQICCTTFWCVKLEFSQPHFWQPISKFSLIDKALSSGHFHFPYTSTIRAKNSSTRALPAQSSFNYYSHHIRKKPWQQSIRD